MLDSTIKFGMAEAKKFPQVPKGIYEVKLEEVEAKLEETYDSKKGLTDEKELANQLTFKWKIQKGTFKDQTLFTNFVPTTFFISPKNGKNKLYSIVEALSGKELSAVDADKFTADDLNALIGKSCTAVVETITKGDKTFSNITTWLQFEEAIPTLEKKHEEINPDDIKF